MALDDIQKSILSEAEQQAAHLVEKAKKTAEEIAAQWNEKVESKKREIMKEAEKKAEQKIQQSEFKLQSQTSAEVLAQRGKLIDKVYQRALQKLKDLGDDEYVNLVRNLIARLPNNVDGELHSAVGKEALLKKALKKSDRKFTTGKEIVKSAGGFVFVSDTVEIDNTFESLIQASKDQTILTVHAVLFDRQSD